MSDCFVAGLRAAAKTFRYLKSSALLNGSADEIETLRKQVEAQQEEIKRLREANSRLGSFLHPLGWEAFNAKSTWMEDI